MAPKKPVTKKTVVKKTATKKPAMGPAKVGTTAEYRALAAENATKKSLTQTANSILTKNATNASNALKAKDAARAVTTASKVGKAASTLGKVARFATKKSVAGTIALTAGASLVDYLNKNSKSGKMPGGKNTTSGRGGRPQGFVPSKTTSNMGKNPIQKGTFRGPLPSTSSTSGSKYRVSSGDTLSGIASRAGVSLADLRAANPQIKDPRKIFRNTGVTIPKGGKMPSGGYTGPVPYKAPKTK